MYPLSKKNDPPKMNFVDLSGQYNNTIHRMDYGYWEEVNSTIQAEPLDGLDADTRGLLASIGIEKGKAFKPINAFQAWITTRAGNLATPNWLNNARLKTRLESAVLKERAGRVDPIFIDTNRYFGAAR